MNNSVDQIISIIQNDEKYEDIDIKKLKVALLNNNSLIVYLYENTYKIDEIISLYDNIFTYDELLFYFAELIEDHIDIWLSQKFPNGLLSKEVLSNCVDHDQLGYEINIKLWNKTTLYELDEEEYYVYEWWL